MARRKKEELIVGEDAFLDTVANLVGILIILVVIVSSGTRTAASLISAEKIKQANEEMEQPVELAINIEKDLARHEEQLAEHTLEVAYRNAERDAILRHVLMAKEAIDEETQKLDEQQREDIQHQQKLNEMERKLAELIQQQGDVASNVKPPIILQHLPTPMAKTVFGKELHVVVQDGMIAVPPWDTLVRMMKEEAKATLQRSTRRERFTGQLGPVEGWFLNYAFISKRGLASSDAGTGMVQSISLEMFELEPTQDALREPLNQALGDHGRLRMELAGTNSRETTVTAWVYPNSYETFRQLKERVFQQGYMTAARPVADGFRIGGAPEGSKSRTQ